MFTYYTQNNLRTLISTGCFLSVIFAPWWVTFLFMILVCVRFRAWEIVGAGIFMDVYWMPHVASFESLQTLPLATIVSFLIVICLEPLRRQLLIGPEIV